MQKILVWNTSSGMRKITIFRNQILKIYLSDFSRQTAMFPDVRDPNFQSEYISSKVYQDIVWNYVKISMIDSIVLSRCSPSLFRWHMFIFEYNNVTPSATRLSDLVQSLRLPFSRASGARSCDVTSLGKNRLSPARVYLCNPCTTVYLLHEATYVGLKDWVLSSSILTANVWNSPPVYKQLQVITHFS